MAIDGPAIHRPLPKDGRIHAANALKGSPPMPIDDPTDLERVDREIRINELKHQASELTNGRMTAWESESCPPEMAEAFWQRMVDYEKLPMTCDFDKLVAAGVELPEPETLTDEQTTIKLWEVIERLAEMRTFLSNTDHLSDRELYADLWSDLLREFNPQMPMDENSHCGIDILGSGREEDTYLYHKYYADEKSRLDWLERWPNDEMPPREKPPYDRDRTLPKR
jgi:hypothetical protein